MIWTKQDKEGLASKLRALKPFDPYRSPLCTCPPKLTLNVYTGCGTECLYCYTSTYARGRWGRAAAWGPRAAVLDDLRRDLERIHSADELAELRDLPVAMSLSSDPYPDGPTASEAELNLTRSCLKMLADAGHPVLIQTKSDLVVRDLDILPETTTVIGLTITTLDEELARQIEPYAPSPERRIAALAAAAGRGFRTICRIDPVIPGVTDVEEDIASLVKNLAAAGVYQVVSSTFKKRHDSARRFAAAFPRAARATEHLYESTERGGYRYLVEPERRRLMERVKDIAVSHGLAFTCCREGMSELNTATCDGRVLKIAC